MTFQSGPGGKGTRHISTKYPAVEGLIAGSTKQVGKRFLTTVKSYIADRDKDDSQAGRKHDQENEIRA